MVSKQDANLCSDSLNSICCSVHDTKYLLAHTCSSPGPHAEQHHDQVAAWPAGARVSLHLPSPLIQGSTVITFMHHDGLVCL